MTGRIHSIESFGTVDGPGVRLVVFMQGCPMRCAYCHNPDTWEINAGTMMEASEITDAFLRNRSYYKNGGITVTGGEPLLQTDFLIQLFTACKKNGIHTCIDTSGITYSPDKRNHIEKLNILMPLTDLVMLDIKHIDPVKHMELTAHPNDGILAFAKYLDHMKVPVWIRHVVVPGITDNDEALFKLGYFIGGLRNLKALDVLPYHSLGNVKYKNLGLDYPLMNVPDMDKGILLTKKQVIVNGIKKHRAEHCV